MGVAPRAWTWGAGIAAAIALVWFTGLSRPPLWTDEALTVRHTDSWRAVTADFHPPLAYAVLRLWRLATPEAVAWWRVFPAILMLAASGTWFAFWRSRVRDGELRASGLAVAGTLLVLSPHVLLFGRMFRYFSLAALLVAVVVVASWRAWERPGAFRVGAAALAVGALASTNYVAAAATGVALAVFVAVRRRDAARRHAAVWGLGAALAAGVVALSSLAASPPAAFGGLDRLGISAAFPLWSATVGETVNVLDLWFVVPAAVAWLAIAVHAAGHLRAAPDVVVLCGLLVVAGIGAAVVGGGVVGLDHTAVQSPKLFLPFAPALYLVAGWALSLGAGSTLRPAAVACLVGIAASWVPGLVHLRTGDDFLYPSYALPWDDVVDDLVPLAAAGAEAGRSVAILSTDAAASELLAARAVRADVIELGAGGTSVRHAGALRPGDYDVVGLLVRDRVNDALTRRLEEARAALDASDLEVSLHRRYGEVDAGLRRLQRRLSGRELGSDLVELVVYERAASGRSG